ncbi:mitochondrial PGP phosphatase-domain-containing protein [Rhizoctonia solani]|nr:mitochondrial PGP phosphatase-domain-containing protein [Rhizoctonia solani]
MSNLHGSIFALRALLRPGLLVPGIKVDTIARLDFAALRQAGYTGAVFDRDNCLTVPHRDTLIPELADAWTRCSSAFGRENMLIVSNSAGTSDDPLGIQAESLSYNLGVPVFRRKYKKPACGEEIVRYFCHKQAYPKPSEPVQRASRQVSISPKSEPPAVILPKTDETPRLLIIGDRLLTDVLLSNTLPSRNDHLSIWTTRLWKTPDLPLLRFIEQTILRAVLWRRNQTFREGVIEQRAKGETWLGTEGWLWWIQRWVLSVVRRQPIPPEPVPPQTNPLAKFVLPIPPVVPWRPTTHLGWSWYYSKIVASYAGKGGWVVLVWAWIGTRSAATRTWALTARKIREARARREEKIAGSHPAQVKSS